MRMMKTTMTICLTLAITTSVFAQDHPTDLTKIDYGAGNKEPIPRTVYWGDTHLHTSFSPDASLAGNVRLSPAEAYRFARGETVTGHNGLKARLDRPLDFLVVSDHAAYMGILPMVRQGNPEVLKTEWGALLSREINKGGDAAYAVAIKFITEAFVDGGVPELKTDALRRPPWYRTTAAAEAANTPGAFTAFIGYEWTSPYGANIQPKESCGRSVGTKNSTKPISALDGGSNLVLD